MDGLDVPSGYLEMARMSMDLPRLWPDWVLSWQHWTSALARLQQCAWAAIAPEKQNKISFHWAHPFSCSYSGRLSEAASSVTAWGRYPLRDFWEELFPKVPKGCRRLIAPVSAICQHCLGWSRVRSRQGCSKLRRFGKCLSLIWAWPLPLESLISCVFYFPTWNTAGAGGL